MDKQGNALSRRDFLKGASASLAALSPPFALDPAANKKVMHIIGHSHIDAAWLWPWRDGADTVLTTFRSALNRMNETPGFCYSHSSSAHYRWVERADPGMFAEIKQRIREGRWEVVGGWPVEPDCNIPSTESFVRHSLYGKEYCQRALGAEVKIGFNPDSFGHAAGLPAILKHAGYGYYVFMRPQEHEMNLPLLFWWEGADGSRILTLRIWKNYDGDAQLVRPAATAHLRPASIMPPSFWAWAIMAAQSPKNRFGRYSRCATTPAARTSLQHAARLFLERREFPGLRFVAGGARELQHHARGCYSANGEGKFLNRRAERWLGEAETISLVANLSAGHAYPAEQYAERWWKVLFCQFHDMMAGTSLYSDYQDVRDSVGYACEVAQTSKVEALETMAKRVDLSKVEEGAVFLFNPLPWKRKALVEFYTDRDPSGKSRITHLASKDGGQNPGPVETLGKHVHLRPALIRMGRTAPVRVQGFELAHGEHPPQKPISNFVTVSETGFGISSLKAEDGTELLSALSDWSRSATPAIPGRMASINSARKSDGLRWSRPPSSRTAQSRASRASVPLAGFRDRSRHCTIRRARFRRAAFRHRLARARADAQA